MSARRRPVILLNSNEVSKTSVQRVRELAEDYEVIVPSTRTDIPGLIGRVEILYGPLSRELFDRADKLRWVNLPFAGFELYSGRLLDDGVVVTNSSGLHGDPIGELAMGMICMFQRGLHLCRDIQQRGSWDRDSMVKYIYANYRPLHEQTLGILGYGRIGRRLAQMAVGCGMRVLGLRQSPRPDEFADKVLGPDGLNQLLAQSDYLACLLPGTPANRHFLRKEHFERMPRHAIFLNYGRGTVVDQDALIEALLEGRIRGAGLDVMEPEPLPDSSPLWKMPNVILCCHYGGVRPYIGEAAFPMFYENLERYLAGEPLLRRVDPRRGY